MGKHWMGFQEWWNIDLPFLKDELDGGSVHIAPKYRLRDLKESNNQ